MTPMEKQLISALAKIDDALGMPQDGCNDLDATLTAIELLHAVIKDNENTINNYYMGVYDSSINLKLKKLLNSVENLIFNSQEYDFDDGLGQGALQQYWDELQISFDDCKENLHLLTLEN